MLGVRPTQPGRGTPARAPGSVRRTTSLDTLRPHGVRGPLRQVARGRDLYTDPDGKPEVRHAAGFVADTAPELTLTALRTDPPLAGLDTLAGTSVAAGFGRALYRAAPALAGLEGPLRQLFDDLPVATLISRHAVAVVLPPQDFLSARAQAGKRDLCAGYADGGTMMLEVDRVGYSVPVACPAAPSLFTEDPWGWHEHEPLPPNGMRRLRRIDVSRDGAEFAVEAWFRDSHADPEGRETVLHEYLLTARVSAATEVVTACSAQARTLPYGECPSALASTGRVVGLPAGELGGHVRRTFTGPSTCTHLNDTLRALSGVPELGRLLG